MGFEGKEKVKEMSPLLPCPSATESEWSVVTNMASEMEEEGSLHRRVMEAHFTVTVLVSPNFMLIILSLSVKAYDQSCRRPLKNTSEEITNDINISERLRKEYGIHLSYIFLLALPQS